MKIAPHTYVTLHRTILDGFNAEFTRWNINGSNLRPIGGFLLRGFGFRFMAYRDKPVAWRIRPA